MTSPFIVTSMGHRFKFTPEELGYSVSELGIKGVNTQGDTFEEALTNALEASSVMAEFREELYAETALANKTRKSKARRSRRCVTTGASR